MSGCSELEELRIANRRQAVTIRDQLNEIGLLTGRLDPNRKISEANNSSVQLETNTSLRFELERLAQSIGGGSVVRETEEGLVIQLPETLLFDAGSFSLKTRDDNVALSQIANHLRVKASLFMGIGIHAVIDPMVKTNHTWGSNHHFSAGRGLSIFDYLVKKEGIDPQRMYVAAYGSAKLLLLRSSTNEEEQNGRVDFFIFQ
ncbi:MAG: OmpA family protein [Candidatus Scalindua sp.]|nr:OmpA family protein [Candidatus Scalindua sp.]